jgi:protein TonB
MKKIAHAKVTVKSQVIPLPEKVVTTQEPIEANNSETPLEKPEVVAQNTKTVEAVNDEPVAVPASDEAFSSEKSTATAHQAEPAVTKSADVAPKAAEPEPLPAPVVKPEAKPVAPAANSSAEAAPATTTPAAAAPTATSSSAPSAATIAAASAASGVQVTQSYTGLKQVSGNKPPTYTRDMRLQNLQGAGQLVYFVNKDGTVSQVQVTKSTGVATLDNAAIDAFSKYKFVPGQEGYTVHNFEFSLKGPAVSDASRLRTTMK